MEYAPEVIETEARRYPSLTALAEGLGGHTRSSVVPVLLDCTDGFNEAYSGRTTPVALKGCWTRTPGCLGISACPS